MSYTVEGVGEHTFKWKYTRPASPTSDLRAHAFRNRGERMSFSFYGDFSGGDFSEAATGLGPAYEMTSETDLIRMLDSITGLGIVIDGIMLHDEFEVSEDAGENSQFRFGGDPVSLGAVGTTLETNFDDLITSLQLQNSSQTVSYILGVPGQEGRLWDNGGTDPPNYFSHRLHYFWISGTGDPRVPSYGDDSRAIAYENTLGTVTLKVQD